MLDVVIRGAKVVDGTGAPARTADVGVRDGRITVVGAVDEPAVRTIGADGLVACPGFVDPHTHYDAQLFWDPWATPSSAHGVTSVIGGNCGFTLAPLHERDADYTRRMMAKVEGMPIAALEDGVPWNWRSFGEYLDRLAGEGHGAGPAVNAGFLVGHCALRRAVLGEAANERAATADEVASMAALLDEALAAGGLGLSTSRSPTHDDGDGGPVPSRAAGVDEVLALCEVVGRHPGTTLEAIIEGCLRRFTPRGGGPVGDHERHGPPSAQLEHPRRRGQGPRPARPPARRQPPGPRAGRSGRRPHHAGARPDDDEPRLVLRPVAHPRVG